jgi:hypothetical protein
MDEHLVAPDEVDGLDLQIRKRDRVPIVVGRGVRRVHPINLATNFFRRHSQPGTPGMLRVYGGDRNVETVATVHGAQQDRWRSWSDQLTLALDVASTKNPGLGRGIFIFHHRHGSRRGRRHFQFEFVELSL